jgi:uncharacterized membrane protein YgdD (TMEM256/DUF423 family)
MSSRLAFRISAVFGFLAVALGAFGAHGLERLLAATDPKGNWHTATLYHLAHAIVMLVLAARDPLPAWAWRFFAVGVLLFSGSLYLFAVTQTKWLIALTPAGGLCLLAGWLALAVRR